MYVVVVCLSEALCVDEECEARKLVFVSRLTDVPSQYVLMFEQLNQIRNMPQNMFSNMTDEVVKSSGFLAVPRFRSDYSQRGDFSHGGHET